MGAVCFFPDTRVVLRACPVPRAKPRKAYAFRPAGPIPGKTPAVFRPRAAWACCPGGGARDVSDSKDLGDWCLMFLSPGYACCSAGLSCARGAIPEMLMLFGRTGQSPGKLRRFFAQGRHEACCPGGRGQGCERFKRFRGLVLDVSFPGMRVLRACPVPGAQARKAYAFRPDGGALAGYAWLSGNDAWGTGRHKKAPPFSGAGFHAVWQTRRPIRPRWPGRGIRRRRRCRTRRHPRPQQPCRRSA